jgi:hypothetical protein
MKTGAWGSDQRGRGSDMLWPEHTLGAGRRLVSEEQQKKFKIQNYAAGRQGNKKKNRINFLIDFDNFVAGRNRA